MTTYPPMPSTTGTLLAEKGALEIMDAYRSGTLPDDTRWFVDQTIDQCERQGGEARQWVDRLVAMLVREWARGQLLGDAELERRSMLVAACALASIQLQSDLLVLA